MHSVIPHTHILHSRSPQSHHNFYRSDPTIWSGLGDKTQPRRCFQSLSVVTKILRSINLPCQFLWSQTEERAPCIRTKRRLEICLFSPKMYYIVYQGQLDEFKQCLMVKILVMTMVMSRGISLDNSCRLANMSKRLNVWCRNWKYWIHKKMFLIIVIIDSWECRTGHSLYHDPHQSCFYFDMQIVRGHLGITIE